jgi:hypothetical protein
VVLLATIAPLASHVPNHAKKFVYVAVKELVVVFYYALQILQTLLDRLHGLETFIDHSIEIRYGVTASRITHLMQSERVIIAIVSSIITIVVATSIVAALGPSGVLSLGCSSQL